MNWSETMSDQQPQPKPSQYDELFPGRFLKAGELGGRAATVTISAVDRESLPQDKGGEKTRGIISFEGRPKQWVLNSTNGQCLKAMFGDKPQQWVGRRATLVSEMVPMSGELVNAVRVKGSPELTEPMRVTIRLPRRKDVVRILQPTGRQQSGGRDSRPSGAVAPEDEPSDEQLGR